MLKIKQIKYYSNLEAVLSRTLKSTLKQTIPSSASASRLERFNKSLLIYALFIDIKDKSEAHVCNYSAADILNDEKALNEQYRLLLGFAYSSFKITPGGINPITKYIETFYKHLAAQSNFLLHDIKISVNTISDDINQCISEFKSLDINEKKLEFYEGWQVQSQDAGKLEVRLSLVYQSYGCAFTDNLHNQLSKYALTRKIKTLRNEIDPIITLFDVLTGIAPTISDFEYHTSPERLHITMYNIYHQLLLNAHINENNIKNFHRYWSTIVKILHHVLVEYKIVSKPIFDIIVPVFKSSQSSNTVSHKTNLADNGNEKTIFKKLLTDIPLSFTDSKAVELILSDIIKDIDHVVYCSEIAIAKTMQNYNHYHDLLKLGDVKRPDETVYSKKGLQNPVPVGPDHPHNVIATFDTFLFDIKSPSSYLGYKGRKTKVTFNNLLCLPTWEALYPFLVLLVNEHPRITPAWLIKWRLYDDNGRLDGFKQIGEQWMATSYKERRGPGLAQQDIVLTEKSKYLIECILKITEASRRYLKSKGNDEYKYMLLTTRSIGVKPKHIQKIREVISHHASQAQKDIYKSPSFSKDGSINRDLNKASVIASNLSLRALRDSCAVRKYIETESVHAMAKTLGHARYIPELIDTYLPSIIWDYFTTRWVRQFQNAIVYEAMKESSRLFDAIDLTPNELDAFIESHGLGELPDAILNGKHRSNSKENDDVYTLSDETVFTISTALLQVFFAIVNAVENNIDQSITKVAQKWFESAKFVLSHLELNTTGSLTRQRSIDREVLDMYETAKTNPLNENAINGVISC